VELVSGILRSFQRFDAQNIHNLLVRNALLRKNS